MSLNISLVLRLPYIVASLDQDGLKKRSLHRFGNCIPAVLSDLLPIPHVPQASRHCHALRIIVERGGGAAP